MPASQRDPPRIVAAIAQALRDVWHGGSGIIIKRGGRRFLLTSEHKADYWFVSELHSRRRIARAAGQATESLLASRPRFRDIIRHERITGLFWCVESREPDVVRLAIWLMGRIRAGVPISEIMPYCHSPDLRIRREVARALRRLNAWAELRAIAEDDDPRVRQLAVQRPAAPFATRLARVTIAAAAPEAPRARPAFFARLPFGPERPLKTPEFIRAMLERIRQLVRG